MGKFSVFIKAIDFQEHPIREDGVSPDLFDIGPDKGDVSLNFGVGQEFNHQLYCTRLLEKIVSLRESFLSAFLDYQVAQVAQPIVWLKNLETLLNANVEELIRLGHASKIHFVIELIEEKCTNAKLHNNKISDRSFDDRRLNFDIWEVKQHCETLKSYQEREAFLLRMKIDYLQVYGPDSQQSGISFLQQIELELEYLEELRRLKPEESVDE